MSGRIWGKGRSETLGGACESGALRMRCIKDGSLLGCEKRMMVVLETVSLCVRAGGLGMC